MTFESSKFRESFPQLEVKVNDHPLKYFDTGASSLKHAQVTDRINRYNRFEASNVHRGAHSLSQSGTEMYEQARVKVQKFINAKDDREIIFTRGTTESINLVANCLSRSVLQPGDEILLSPFEHHSNIVPWQMICEEKGYKLKVIDFDPECGVTEESFLKSITDKTKVMAFLWYSNSFGNRLPVEKIVEECAKQSIITVIDAAQAVLTERMDVQAVPCDFLTFSGHKMFAPYGIGALYGKLDLLEKIPPYQGGGSMIDRVTFDKTVYANVPQKFEAGTPNVSGAIGLGEAVDVIEALDFKSYHAHVASLRNHLLEGLKKIPQCKVFDFKSSDYAGVVSFQVDGSHPSDVGTLLNQYGFAVRAGHHCTQPLMALLGIEGTVRASFTGYNTVEEVDAFVATVSRIVEFF